MCCSYKDLSTLGPGFALYYHFVVYCAKLLFVLFLVIGVYGCYKNLNEEFKDTDREGYWVTSTIASRYGLPVDENIGLLLILMVLVVRISNYCFRK